MVTQAVPSLSLLRVLIPKGQRAKWGLVAFLGIALAFAESLAAISIAVLVDAMTADGESSIDLPILGNVMEWLPGANEQEKLWFLAGGLATFFILKAGLAFLEVYTRERVAENTGARIGSRLFAGYLRMPYLFHIRHNSSELIRNASWATDEVVRSFLKPMAKILTQVSMLVFLTSVLIASAPSATLITIGVLGPLTWIVVRLVKPSLHRLGKETKHAVQLALRSLQQSLHGIRDVKVLKRERFFSREYRSTRYELARAKYKYPSISEIPRLTIETLLVIAILGFVAFGSGIGDQASLALLGMFAYAGLRIMPAMSAIVSAVNRIRYGTSVAETVAEDLTMVETEAGRSATTSETDVTFTDSLKLSNVNFRYDPDHVTLRDIDLEIQPGEIIGIVGETGAGKSTLLDLLLGLLTPTSGRIALDGHDLREVLSGWHEMIGLVPQSIYLLDDTIRRNIAYGVRDQDIVDDHVLAAVKLARLERFVESLPQKLDTVVGEQGVRLSGGQRQRVAIARALYRRPQVLILDEGTASLDNVTEAELMRSIDPLKGSMTIIMVAHRLSTVQECDRILLVSDGGIADQGTFEDLRKRNLEFRKMTG